MSTTTSSHAGDEDAFDCTIRYQDQELLVTLPIQTTFKQLLILLCQQFELHTTTGVKLQDSDGCSFPGSEAVEFWQDQLPDGRIYLIVDQQEQIAPTPTPSPPLASASSTTAAPAPKSSPAASSKSNTTIAARTAAALTPKLKGISQSSSSKKKKKTAAATPKPTTAPTPSQPSSAVKSKPTPITTSKLASSSSSSRRSPSASPSRSPTIAAAPTVPNANPTIYHPTPSASSSSSSSSSAKKIPLVSATHNYPPSIEASLWRIFSHYSMFGPHGNPDHLSQQMFFKLLIDCKLANKNLNRRGAAIEPQPSPAVAELLSPAKDNNIGLSVFRSPTHLPPPPRTPLRRSDVELIYINTLKNAYAASFQSPTATSAAIPSNSSKMTFEVFCHALLQVAILFYGEGDFLDFGPTGKKFTYPMQAFVWDVEGYTGLLQQLLYEHVLPNAQRWDEDTQAIKYGLLANDADLKQVIKHFERVLGMVFKVYANAPDANTTTDPTATTKDKSWNGTKVAVNAVAIPASKLIPLKSPTSLDTPSSNNSVAPGVIVGSSSVLTWHQFQTFCADFQFHRLMLTPQDSSRSFLQAMYERQRIEGAQLIQGQKKPDEYDPEWYGNPQRLSMLAPEFIECIIRCALIGMAKLHLTAPPAHQLKAFFAHLNTALNTTLQISPALNSSKAAREFHMRESQTKKFSKVVHKLRDKYVELWTADGKINYFDPVTILKEKKVNSSAEEEKQDAQSPHPLTTPTKASFISSSSTSTRSTSPLRAARLTSPPKSSESDSSLVEWRATVIQDLVCRVLLPLIVSRSDPRRISFVATPAEAELARNRRAQKQREREAASSAAAATSPRGVNGQKVLMASPNLSSSLGSTPNPAASPTLSGSLPTPRPTTASLARLQVLESSPTAGSDRSKTDFDHLMLFPRRRGEMEVVFGAATPATSSKNANPNSKGSSSLTMAQVVHGERKEVRRSSRKKKEDAAIRSQKKQPKREVERDQKIEQTWQAFTKTIIAKDSTTAAAALASAPLATKTSKPKVTGTHVKQVMKNFTPISPNEEMKQQQQDQYESKSSTPKVASRRNSASLKSSLTSRRPASRGSPATGGNSEDEFDHMFDTSHDLGEVQPPRLGQSPQSGRSQNKSPQSGRSQNKSPHSARSQKSPTPGRNSATPSPQSLDSKRPLSPPQAKTPSKSPRTQSPNPRTQSPIHSVGEEDPSEEFGEMGEDDWDQAEMDEQQQQTTLDQQRELLRTEQARLIREEADRVAAEKAEKMRAEEAAAAAALKAKEAADAAEKLLKQQEKEAKLKREQEVKEEYERANKKGVPSPEELARLEAEIAAAKNKAAASSSQIVHSSPVSSAASSVSSSSAAALEPQTRPRVNSGSQPSSSPAPTHAATAAFNYDESDFPDLDIVEPTVAAKVLEDRLTGGGSRPTTPGGKKLLQPSRVQLEKEGFEDPSNVSINEEELFHQDTRAKIDLARAEAVNEGRVLRNLQMEQSEREKRKEKEIILNLPKKQQEGERDEDLELDISGEHLPDDHDGEGGEEEYEDEEAKAARIRADLQREVDEIVAAKEREEAALKLKQDATPAAAIGSSSIKSPPAAPSSSGVGSAPSISSSSSASSLPGPPSAADQLRKAAADKRAADQLATQAALQASRALKEAEENEVRRLKLLVAEGDTFTKYTPKVFGVKQEKKFVRISAHGDKLFWGKDPNSLNKSLNLNEITEVRGGATTKAFAKLSAAVSDSALSIITGTRSLDLLANHPRQRNDWLTYLRQFVKPSR